MSRRACCTRAAPIDLLAVLSLRDWEAAEMLLRHNPKLLDAGGGVLHLMAKRNDVGVVKWLLDHRADPNGRWARWDAHVTPLHLAAMQGHVEVARMLLADGADPRIRDSKHDSDAIGWAEFFRKPDVGRLLTNLR